MNQLKVFEFGKSELRTEYFNNQVWFCLKDLAEILEIKNHRDLKRKLKNDGVVSIDVTDKLGRYQPTTFVNENNLYRVIFQSRKAEAEQFQDWVYEEVLPQIRKTGKYEVTKDPLEIMKLSMKAIEQTNVEVENLKDDVTYLKDEVKLDAGEYGYITRLINRTVMESATVYGYANTKEVRKALFSDINRGINEICGIRTRTQLRQKHFDKATQYINVWTPSTATRMKVQQLTMDIEED